MKKFFCLLIAAFTFLVIPIAIFAQDSPPPGGDVVTLPDLPITFAFGAYVATFLLYAATVVMLTSIINKFITNLKGFAKQYLSWFVALLVGFVAFFLNLGIFEPLQWYQVLIYAFAAGLGANGVFDWQLIQAILRGLKLEPPLEVPLK
jgi:hypothetical protein